MLVREVGGDLKDLLSRGIGSHVKRSALRRELWQSEYKIRVDLKPISSEGAPSFSPLHDDDGD